MWLVPISVTDALSPREYWRGESSARMDASPAQSEGRCDGHCSTAGLHATLDPGCVLQSPQGESAAAKGEEAAVAVRQADNRNTPAPP